MLRFIPVFLSLALCAPLGCAGGGSPGPGGETNHGPRIVSLSPSSGPAGEAYPIRVTIQGSGFAEAGNIVTFGGIPSRALPSSEGGTQIVFLVPKEAPSSGEVPPMVLTPGEYSVTVTTSDGISESVMFTLTRGN